MRPTTTTTSVRIKREFARYGLTAGMVVSAEVTRSPYIPAYRGGVEAVWTAPSGIAVSLGVVGMEWEVVA